MPTHLESFCTRLWLACRWRPNSFLVWVHVRLGEGDYVAIRQLDGSFAGSHDFALLAVAESDCAARSDRIVRKPFGVRGYVKCGTGVQQPCVCILRIVVDFSYRRVL